MTYVAAMAMWLSFTSGLIGCATERWPRSTVMGQRPQPDATATTLRVAVQPFANESVVEGNTDIFAAWFLAGLVVVPQATYTYQWDRPQLVTFVHDIGRIFSIALYDQLKGDPNFELVGFEPFEQEHYDLILRGRVRRIGFARWLPFVPLPFWVGSAISMASGKDTFISEIDLVADASLGESAVSYGLQAGCVTTEPGCGPSHSEAFAAVLRRGYVDFLLRLDGYLTSRGEAFWRDARAASRDRYYGMLDPSISALDSEIAGAAEPRASQLRTWRDDRIALLETLRAVEDADERAWAETSDKRVEAEMSKTNANAERAQAAAVRAIALSSAITVAGGVAAGRTFGPTSDQVTQELARARIGGEAAAESLRKYAEGKRKRLVDDALEAVLRAGNDRRDRRRAWLAYYQDFVARSP